MSAISIEFNKVCQDIKAEQSSRNLVKVLHKRRKFGIVSTTYTHGSIEINGSFRITTKVVTRFVRQYKCTGAEAVERIMGNTFYICSLASINVVWVETSLGMISFLQTPYQPTALSQWTPQGESYQDSLIHLMTDDLHISLVALSYVALPFGLKEFPQHEKCYLVLRHLKSMVELFKNTSQIFDDFVLRNSDQYIFNSKLLGRDYNPIIVGANLSQTGALTSIDIIDETFVKPLYIEPQIELHDLLELDVHVDVTAEKHLRQRRFRDIIDIDSIHAIDKLTRHSIQKAVYIKDIVTPLIYKGYAALGVRIYTEANEPVYSVGYFPTNGVFRIRTVMSPEVVCLNNKTLTSLYSAEELVRYGRPQQ